MGEAAPHCKPLPNAVHISCMFGADFLQKRALIGR
jgi:hypothetical protein